MNDTRNILIVSGACYPELTPRAFRTTELARQLARRGHRVTLLLPNRAIFHEHPLREEGLEVIFASGPVEGAEGSAVSRRNGRLRRFMPEIVQKAVLYFYCHELWAKYDPGLCARLAELRGPFDAVLSISYPAAVHLAVARAMRRNPVLRRAVTIAEFSDPPFRGDVAQNVFPGYYLWLKRWGRLFDWFAVPVEKALPCYTPYMDRSRIRVIPQGFDLDAIPLPDYVPHSEPTFAYAGRFYENIRDPQFFFDFLETVDSPFCFDLYINHLDGRFADMIRRAQQRVRGRIVLHDPLPREQLIGRLAEADFLVNFDNTTSNATPSKLIDYAIARRPILSFNDRTFDAGAFRAALRGDYAGQVRGIDLADYDIRTVAARFLALIDEGKRTDR